MNSRPYDVIANDGFAILASVYSDGMVEEICVRLQQALATTEESDLLRTQSGVIYGARNLLRLFPDVCELYQRPVLLDILLKLLGPECGLVRGLYFDKPPGGSWSLPWHRDLTIAVQDNSLPSQQFCKPTTKAGVPHVEAPNSILDQMLTLRIHLDAATAENGALKVIAGSHRNDHDAQSESQVVSGNICDVLAHKGDVLAMRPRIVHGSIGALRDTSQHRRVLHLEFAAEPRLPDGYDWASFVPVRE